eukprot:TRINITY_DN10503_c0_g4_i3.p1 TRINITY_DN10503_c0_g4~~TRINITY_DN10503_c0_g4_i3.p1  ORF type:complete len:247 (+),score=59.15 TRINITY_DN10503_c0_g4_i3:161-901(+)
MSFHIFALLLVLAEFKKCPQLRSGSDILAASGCMIPNGLDTDTLYVKECDGDDVCFSNAETSVGFCRRYIPFKKMPGEYCDEMNECHNRACTVHHKCFGRGEGSECESHEDCNYDFACNHTKGPDGKTKGTCVRLQRGGKCIEKMCDPPYVCNMGDCVKFASVSSGLPADNWLACKYLYVHNDKCVSQYQKDIDSPGEGICKYSYVVAGVNNTFTEEPVCGNDSKPFCNEPRHSINKSNVTYFFNS